MNGGCGAYDNALHSDLLQPGNCQKGSLEIVPDGNNDRIELLQSLAPERRLFRGIEANGMGNLVLDLIKPVEAVVDGENIRPFLGQSDGKVYAKMAHANDR